MLTSRAMEEIREQHTYMDSCLKSMCAVETQSAQMDRRRSVDNALREAQEIEVRTNECGGACAKGESVEAGGGLLRVAS